MSKTQRSLFPVNLGIKDRDSSSQSSKVFVFFFSLCDPASNPKNISDLESNWVFFSVFDFFGDLGFRIPNRSFDCFRKGQMYKVLQGKEFLRPKLAQSFEEKLLSSGFAGVKCQTKMYHLIP